MVGSVAVVGADGFLGSATAGAMEVTGVPTTRFTRLRSFLDPAAPPVHSFDTIFWLASSIRPGWADEATAGEDLAAVRGLLSRTEDAARSGRCRVVVVSSGGTIYDAAHPPPHDEQTLAVAANAYGQAMLEIEAEVRARAPQWSVLRVANAYGPGQRPRRGQGVIAHWFDRIATDRPIELLGDDHLARDYVYVDDVVVALGLVHHRESSPGVLNIGSGRGTGLGELLDAVRATVHPLEVTVARSASRGFDAPSTWLAVDRAASTLGWTPTVDLADGLARTWAARRSVG